MTHYYGDPDLCDWDHTGDGVFFLEVTQDMSPTANTTSIRGSCYNGTQVDLKEMVSSVSMFYDGVLFDCEDGFSFYFCGLGNSTAEPNTSVYDKFQMEVLQPGEATDNTVASIEYFRNGVQTGAINVTFAGSLFDDGMPECFFTSNN